jgi:hypothetical protein
MPLPNIYDFNDRKPPLSPAAKRHTQTRRQEDSARYILVPDEDFQRPYLAVPGTREAFVWPAGVEGFELQKDTALGIHRYLGEAPLEVSVTHQGEKRINMSGIFPGWTAVENMHALERVYDMPTEAKGKILHLPGILPQLKYVIGESLRFSHTEEDFLEDLAYQVTFVVTGGGATTPTGRMTSGVTGQPAEGFGTTPKGNASNVFVTTAQFNTLRRIALHLFKSADRWVDLYQANSTFFDVNNIASFRIPNFQLPLGMKIYY